MASLTQISNLKILSNLEELWFTANGYEGSKLTSLDLKDLSNLKRLNVNFSTDLSNILNYTDCSQINNISCSATDISQTLMEDILAFLANGSVNDGFCDFRYLGEPSPAALAYINTLVSRNWQILYMIPASYPRISVTWQADVGKVRNVFQPFIDTNDIILNPPGYVVVYKEINELYPCYAATYNAATTCGIPILTPGNTYLGYIYVENANTLTGVILYSGFNLANPNADIINITGLENYPNITVLDIRNNALSASLVNYILTTLDSNGKVGGTVYLQGGTNAAPSGAGITAKANLITKGWIVTTN